MNFPPTLRLTEEIAGYPVLEVAHPAAIGRIALHGAHVMEWTPAHAVAPVLYMSPEAIFKFGTPIRGGIPVCWPWFGPAAERDKPAHGFVRTMLWAIETASEDADGVQIVLTLSSSPESRTLWPHEFEARLHVQMGRELSVGLDVRNTDSETWTMTGALHSYFAVGDVKQIAIAGLYGTEYVEPRLSSDKRRQLGPLVIDHEVDRVYISDACVVVQDPVWKRELCIDKAGSLSTVVWNPWIEKSKLLADLPNEAYPEFVCVETVNAREDRIDVAPGGSHLLLTRLSVRNLNA